MAKPSYKIPVSIDRSILDHRIVIRTKAINTKPIAIKTILYWTLVLFITGWVVMQSPLSAAPWFVLALLALWMLVTGAVMGRLNKTGEMVFTQVRPLLEYIPKRNRVIMTRRNSPPYGFLSIVGIKDVEASGIIRYVDGDYGQLYSVVGSASVLLFQNDREAIVRRVKTFWQKVDTESSLCFVTTKESQRVFQQVAAIEYQNRLLENRHPELIELEQEKLDVLIKDVGGQFSSLHQYLLVRSPSMKALTATHKVLAAERASSSLMLRRCELLSGADTLEVLSSIYQAPSPEQRKELV